MSDFGFTEQDKHELIAILQKHPEVEQAVIFGSRAMGHYRPNSDVDMTLKGQNLTSKIASQIGSEIESSNIPYLFDLSIYHQLNNKNFIQHIESEGKIFYQKPD